MQNLYVKKQANSQYLEDVQLQPIEGYTQLAQINDEQKIKLLNFTDKCFLNENGALVVPGQVPMSDEQQEAMKLKNKINELATSNANLQTDVKNAKSDAEAKQKQLDGQQYLINFFSKKLNDLGANVQDLMNDAKKSESTEQNTQAVQDGGQK